MLAQLEAAAAAAGDTAPASSKPPPMKVSAFSLGRTYCRFALGESPSGHGQPPFLRRFCDMFNWTKH